MSFNILGKNTKFELAKSLVKKVYLADNRPWVVGYSGGKDSTAVVQLVFSALTEIDSSLLTKKVYVISSDTLVETPMIIDSITRTLGRIQDHALKIGLPIESHKVRPETDKTFWSSIIGKGYPTPRQTFRWCTDRMKIDPANKFILDKVSKFGEVIMVLGVRDSESSTRSGVMKAHTTEGKDLMKHSSLNNAFVFAPIRNFVLDDVWEYLLETISPWGDNNHDLLKLYQDSNSECPLVIDKDIKESAGTCGNSRFGCWTCTVVSEDKALSGFINSGSDWMRPLLEYRNWLASIRDKRQYRQKHRMNGQVYLTTNLENINVDECEKINESELGDYIKKNNIDLANIEDLKLIIIDSNGNFTQLGLGPYTLKARELILRKLLKTQMEVRRLYEPTIELITIDELKSIRKFWAADGHIKDPIPSIYEEIVGEYVKWEYNDRPLFHEDQITDLERLCSEQGVSLSLLKKLIGIEKDYSGYKVRRGLQQEFNKTIKQGYLHL